MKRIFLMIATVMALLLSGCQSDHGTDRSAYRDDMAKAQEIAVVPADTAEVIDTITDTEEIENFVSALHVDQWELGTLPDKASEIGTFGLAQEKTIRLGQTDADGTLHDVATITLYDGGYIRVEMDGFDMTFAVSKDTAEYLNGYFA